MEAIKPHKPHKRRQLSCLPCRMHKLKCDRNIPCHACTRYRRTERCEQHPASSTLAPARGAAVQLVQRPIAASDQDNIRPKVIYFTGVGLEQLASRLQTSALFDTQAFWRSQLLALLPTQNQCDFLVAFYFEHTNWIYSVIHPPSFRIDYHKLWTEDQSHIDLIWLAQLFSMLSLSALFIPPSTAEAMSFDCASIRNMAYVWQSASRQALFSGGAESKPKLTQIAVFLTNQIYWLSIKDGETLNSCLGQAVRNAQALRLDRDTSGSTPLETEMRRRIWHELCVCDTFQALCLGRMPLINSNSDRVPNATNCDDADLTPHTAPVPKPIDVPTDCSASIFKAESFKIFRKLFVEDGAHMNSWNHVSNLDRQIEALVTSMPWHHDQAALVSGRYSELVATHPQIIWQHSLLHSSILIQRMRILRPFLATHADAYATSSHVLTQVLDGHKFLRSHPLYRRSPKSHIIIYQCFAAALQQAAFLLVEKAAPASLRDDIELVLHDISQNPLGLPLLDDAQKILRRMLRMIDHRRDHNRDPATHDPPEAMAKEISAVLGGGEGPTRRYLRRSRAALEDPAYNTVIHEPVDPPSLEYCDFGPIDPGNMVDWFQFDLSMMSMHQGMYIQEDMGFALGA